MDHKVSWNKILAEDFKPDAKRKQRLKTGFDSLDRKLGGGLSPGLIVLGGTPGAGKSTFALQLAEHVAASGTLVLYFSMEMPGESILAKAISRNLYKKNREQEALWLSAVELMNGRRDKGAHITQEQWEQVDAIKRSPELGLDHLHLWTDAVSVSTILERVKQVRNLPGFADQKPLVIIDYLQILSPEDSRSQTEKQIVDKTLKLLMSELAHGENGVPVILISSLNRSGYDSIGLGVFKETGGIEYSADVLLGLQSSNQPGDSVEEDKEDEEVEDDNVDSVEEVKLFILKNRYGPSTKKGRPQKLKFLYHTRYDYFEPLSASAVKEVRPPADAAVPVQTKKKETKPAGKYFSSYINNTKIANEIRKGAFGKRSCKVFEDICTDYSLSEPLSSLDCCVADAIYTLYKAAEDPQNRQAPVELSLSLSNILFVLTGNHQRTLTNSKADELEHSIDHLMKTKFSMDCTKELLERAKKRMAQSKRRRRKDGTIISVHFWSSKNVCEIEKLARSSRSSRARRNLIARSYIASLLRMQNTASFLCIPTENGPDR